MTYYPAEFKIAWENRYIWIFCMNLISAVCRPAGHRIDITELETSGDSTYSARKAAAYSHKRIDKENSCP
jgi:hypothetical protein